MVPFEEQVPKKALKYGTPKPSFFKFRVEGFTGGFGWRVQGFRGGFGLRVLGLRVSGRFRVEDIGV